MRFIKFLFRRRRYPVVCAWCESEGRRTVVNWSPAPGSHGICHRHSNEWFYDAPQTA